MYEFLGKTAENRNYLLMKPKNKDKSTNTLPYTGHNLSGLKVIPCMY